MGSTRRSPRYLNALAILLVFAAFWHISRIYRAPAILKLSFAEGHKYASHTPLPQNSVESPPASNPKAISPHPIDMLIEQAELSFQSLLAKKTEDLPSTAAAYRRVRGRHPPPGFDAWYELAKDHNVIMVEEFWDQIYHDLTPFWALPPSQIRTDARAYDMVVKIESGRAESNTGWFWHRIWADMIDTVSDSLPDMVIPLNSMDESRLMVPWEKINDSVEIERASRVFVPIEEVVSEYRNWRKDDIEGDATATDVAWSHSMPFSLSRLACAPDSAIREFRSIPQAVDRSLRTIHGQPKYFEDDVDFTLLHSRQGFVSNYSLATSICHQPDLGGMHGALIQPLTSSSSPELIPLFGGSKFAVNNDILLPAPMYWAEDERFSAGEESGKPWHEKEDAAVWRGTATGGHNTPTNWHQFHRHRFVALTNGTKYLVSDHQSSHSSSQWSEPNQTHNLRQPIRDNLADWLISTTNISFTDLMCDVQQADGGCWYTSDHFAVTGSLPLRQQFDYKYLPDIDGNSFSGRYRAFLRSTSLPIKATLYREWHDARLVAWKHFVPMDNRFHDFFGIMEYFRGSGPINGELDQSVEGHDAAAEKIASEGKDWTEKALRKEDMQVYVLRLLLEYARVTDDRRDQLAYVDDLKTP